MKKLLSLLSLALSLALPGAAQPLVPSAPDVLRLESFRAGPHFDVGSEPILLAKSVRGVHKMRFTAAVAQTAIEAPQNNFNGPGPTLFLFTGTNLIQVAPATYIWNAYFHQQAGYTTTFFYDALNVSGTYVGDNSYFGCHPYPDGGGDTPTTHHFEISNEGADYITDLNGYSTAVTKERWYRQAVRITLVGGKLHIEFFWDIAAGMDHVIDYQWTNTMDQGASPGLAWLASPWPLDTDFRIKETMYGRLRNLQLYATNLSNANIQSASACDNDACVSGLALSSPWYWNVNLKPSDIADKSGQGHNPSWVNSSYTGTQWTGP